MISVKFENLEEMSKWTRLFSVNGLGLNFCGIFEEKNYRSDFGKKRREKISGMSVTFDNLEKMRQFF